MKKIEWVSAISLLAILLATALEVVFLKHYGEGCQSMSGIITTYSPFCEVWWICIGVSVVVLVVQSIIFIISLILLIKREFSIKAFLIIFFALLATIILLAATLDIGNKNNRSFYPENIHLNLSPGDVNVLY